MYTHRAHCNITKKYSLRNFPASAGSFRRLFLLSGILRKKTGILCEKKQALRKNGAGKRYRKYAGNGGGCEKWKETS